MQMKIAIFGTGYVGLVTGACLAAMGNTVVCVDIDERKVNLLKSGKVPFYEPGLEPLIVQGQEQKHLFFTTEGREAARSSEIIFIAVGTPPKEDGSADLSYVLSAAREIGRGLQAFTVIATKSTVPIGTSELVRETIRSETQVEFAMASCPEFLKEGDAVNDFMKPDRIVVGCDDPRAVELMRELFSPFVRTENPVLFMDIRSSEMTKYAANCMLATKISFINEIANICEQVGADVSAVRRGMGTDHRIGFQFLHPGLGYGGSCFPKDVEALIHTAKAAGYPPHLLESVNNLNQAQRVRFLQKITTHFGSRLEGLQVAVWGLSFKPRTDDIREAPALTIINALLEKGAVIRAYDPEAMENVRALYGDRLRLCPSAMECLEGVSALVVATEWNEFRTPDFDRMKQLMAEPVIFDGRNLYAPAAMQRRGFVHYGIGLKG